MIYIPTFQHQVIPTGKTPMVSYIAAKFMPAMKQEAMILGFSQFELRSLRAQ